MAVHRGCVRGFVLPDTTTDPPATPGHAGAQARPGKTCLQCGAELPKFRRKFCCDECREIYGGGVVALHRRCMGWRLALRQMTATSCGNALCRLRANLGKVVQETRRGKP